MDLMKYIPTGRENAIPARDLAKVSGLKDVRTLQTEIHRLRRSGAVILSATDCPAGYFLPETDHEVRAFVRSMHSRIAQISEAAKAAEQYLTE